MSKPEGTYSVTEMADKTGISAYTLRYYDKCGFFPNLIREKNGKRWFGSADIEQLHLIEALRKSGLSIEGIQYFVKLSLKGDASLEERRAIVNAQTTVLSYQLEEIERGLNTLQVYLATHKPSDGVSAETGSISSSTYSFENKTGS